MTFEERNSRIVLLLSDILDLPVASISKEFDSSKTDSWDSLAHVKILFALEQEFSVRFETDEISVMLSLAGIHAILDEKGS